MIFNHFLNLINKYLINNQLYVSLMGTFMSLFFMFEQDVFRWPVTILVFLTYLNGYIYTKNQDAKIFFKSLIINVLFGIICLILILNKNEISFTKWLVIVGLGLLYNSFFLNRYIRKIPLLKVFYVGLTWALVNAWLVLPMFNEAIFIITILFVSALVLPFDIRDMKTDHIITFPKIIGVQNTKYLAFALIFIAIIIGIRYLKLDFALSLYLTSIISFIFIYFSENKNPDAYFSVGVESCAGLPMIFWEFINLIR